MTLKEVINTLKVEYLGDSERMELAKHIAVEVLEKQIPKKVKRCEKKNEDFLVQGYLIDGSVVKWFECPKCGKHQLRYFKYCHFCGQALEWEEV